MSSTFFEYLPFQLSHKYSVGLFKNICVCLESKIFSIVYCFVSLIISCNVTACIITQLVGSAILYPEITVSD